MCGNELLDVGVRLSCRQPGCEKPHDFDDAQPQQPASHINRMLVTTSRERLIESNQKAQVRAYISGHNRTLSV
jgi:hypothetical protein